jgi:hypothetical protein
MTVAMKLHLVQLARRNNASGLMLVARSDACHGFGNLHGARVGGEIVLFGSKKSIPQRGP